MLFSSSSTLVLVTLVVLNLGTDSHANAVDVWKVRPSTYSTEAFETSTTTEFTEVSVSTDSAVATKFTDSHSHGLERGTIPSKISGPATPESTNIATDTSHSSKLTTYYRWESESTTEWGRTTESTIIPEETTTHTDAVTGNTAGFTGSTAEFTSSTTEFTSSTTEFTPSTTEITQTTPNFAINTAEYTTSTTEFAQTTPNLARNTTGWITATHADVNSPESNATIRTANVISTSTDRTPDSTASSLSTRTYNMSLSILLVIPLASITCQVLSC